VTREPDRGVPPRPHAGGASEEPGRGGALREPPGRDEHIIEDLRRVYATLQLVNLPTWLKLGLTMAQFKALVTIENKGAVTVSGLGSELSIGESAASLLTEQLVRREYAERRTDPDDRRRVLVSVTALGRELIAELRHGRRQTLNDWLADLDAADAAALSQGLGALAAVAAAREAELRGAGRETDEVRA
jgi:DNA-binding MarR family transcriptional regulator